MRAGFVHHAPSALRHVRVLGTQHEPLLESRESSVSHVFEARELGLHEKGGYDVGQGDTGGKDSSCSMTVCRSRPNVALAPILSYSVLRDGASFSRLDVYLAGQEVGGGRLMPQSLNSKEAVKLRWTTTWQWKSLPTFTWYPTQNHQP